MSETREQRSSTISPEGEVVHQASKVLDQPSTQEEKKRKSTGVSIADIAENVPCHGEESAGSGGDARATRAATTSEVAASRPMTTSKSMTSTKSEASMRPRAPGLAGGDVASLRFDFNVFKGDTMDTLRRVNELLDQHADLHGQHGANHQIVEAQRQRAFQELESAKLERQSNRSSISDLDNTLRNLIHTQHQELLAILQQQAAYAAQVQEKFEDDLRQKMDKSLAPMRQVQDLLYKIASLDERMESLESQFRERVNTLEQMHRARLDRVENASIGVLAQRVSSYENKLLELQLAVQRLGQPTWHRVDSSGYSSLHKSPEELSRLTNDVEGDINSASSNNCWEPLSQDSWGASVLLICKELPDVCSKQDKSLSCILMVALPCICCLTLFLQFVLINLLSGYIINPAVADMHQSYCQSKSTGPITSSWFMGVALWMWMMALIGEVRSCVSLSMILWRCPSVKHSEDMAFVRYVDDAGKDEDTHGDVHGVRIVGLTAGTRCTLLATLIAPRLFLAMWLGWIGSQWLAATHRYSDLLLHTLALQLILHIDSVVYAACVPDSYRAKVQKSTIERADSAKEHITEVSRSTTLKTMCLTIVLVLLCLMYVVAFPTYFVTEYISNADCSLS